MQIVNTTTGEIITRQDLEASLRTEGPDGEITEVSLPRDLTGVDLSEFGAAVVEPSDPPEAPEGKVAVPDGAEMVDGIWKQKWRIEDVPTHVPHSVTMRQARLALHRNGHLATVEAAIATAGVEAEIEWQAARDVYRDSPLAQSMAAVLGLPSHQVDDLFIEAASI